MWIISFGESSRRRRIINSRGYYGIFGKEGIVNFLVIWIWILEIRLNWQKQNQHSGLRHMYPRKTGESYRSSLQPFLRFQEDGASQMALGRRMIFSQDKVGLVL
ncbi:hypothetical protein Bca101_097683 [Brassica carinata]